VTFQIGMVGSDGVLLASDTLCTHLHIADGAIRTGTTSNSPKIQIENAKGIAYCWSGDEFGRIAVATISDLFREGSRTDIRSFLRECGVQAVNRAGDQRSVNPTTPLSSCEVLVAIRSENNYMSLWSLRMLNTVEHQFFPAVERVTTKAVTGDAVNSAVFFSENYFSRFCTLPIAELVPLAAHTVLMAGRLSSGVGGLQIVLCRGDGFTELGSNEISAIEEQAANRDSAIADSFRVRQ